jgi:hypothetical protein
MQNEPINIKSVIEKNNQSLNKEAGKYSKKLNKMVGNTGV